MSTNTQARPMIQSAEEALAAFFGPDRIHTAAAILIALFKRDPLVKREYAGVRVDEVKEACEQLGYPIVEDANVVPLLKR